VLRQISGGFGAAANRRRSMPRPTGNATLSERALNRLLDWCAIATRSDKRDHNFLAGICLAAAII
jgi:hypothetical protein